MLEVALDYDIVIFVIYKFIKRITLISENIIWKAQQWDLALLNNLNVAD